MLKIGAQKISNWLVMAPMAGITNLPFRIMVKSMGAGLVFSEMVSAMGLSLSEAKTLTYLRSHPAEKPLAVQIFGSSPDIMAKAAQKVIEGGADLVDINMGCPVKKVTKTGAGASLMRNPILVARIISAVRPVCDVPLTVKIRMGWSPEEPNAVEVAKIIQDCGADGLIIHGRFASQHYSGIADWEIIKIVKSEINIPVIGNGDVSTPSDALQMKNQTGCDGVMVGRAAVTNPWIFRQTMQIASGLPVEQPDLWERKALIQKHYSLLTNILNEHRAALRMRGLLLRYTKGLPHSSRFRQKISCVRDRQSLTHILDDYFKQLEETED